MPRTRRFKPLINATRLEIPSQTSMSRLMTVPELASHFHMHPHVVRRWTQQRGFPPSILIERGAAYHLEDVMTWLSEQS